MSNKGVYRAALAKPGMLTNEQVKSLHLKCFHFAHQTGAMSKFQAKNSSEGSQITARRRAEVRGRLEH